MAPGARHQAAHTRQCAGASAAGSALIGGQERGDKRSVPLLRKRRWAVIKLFRLGAVRTALRARSIAIVPPATTGSCGAREARGGDELQQRLGDGSSLWHVASPIHVHIQNPHTFMCATPECESGENGWSSRGAAQQSDQESAWVAVRTHQLHATYSAFNQYTVLLQNHWLIRAQCAIPQLKRLSG